MKAERWTTEENEFLTDNAYRMPWAKIAKALGRTEAACKAHHKKLMKLRQATGTWKGIK